MRRPGSARPTPCSARPTAAPSRGTDVVVGLVETHGRAKTAALLDGLEVLPRRTVSYRGMELTELDVDAVLARAPQVVLVDELAHTNAPGSRHAKRWQDVDDLLEAGITVLTTVNIQHLESLNDVIERITGVRQQETVPDEVVRRAQQVELVDITPEALRRRMAHGNVYAPEKVDAAMANYFQPRNLTALREMALLWLADQVEVALQRYRTDQQVTDIWETRERVVVALTGGPESETVLRRAARIAERTESAELFAVHVLRGDGLAGAPVGALAGLRRLAEDVGASFHTVVADDVPTALLDFARGVDATQLVIGTSRRSRPARVLVESIGARVVQDSGHIDVHMVTHAEAGRGIRLPRRFSAVPAARRAAGWALGLLLPLTAVGIGILGRDVLGLSTDVVLFFLATVISALVGGLGPALLAAVAGGLLLNFFLTPPLYTFTIAERENVITLVAMVLVAVLVALVVDRAARRAQQAAQARAEAALLASFSRTVLTRADPLPRLLEKIREAFALTSVAILERRDGRWTVSACAGPRRLHPPRAGGRRRRRRPRHPPRRSRPRRWPPPSAACSTPSPARPCSPCATSRSPPRPPRRGAAPTPPSCAPRCSRPSATTCAPRWRRSRRRPGACATSGCGCPSTTGPSSPPRSRSRPTGSPAWSTTCSTPPAWPPARSPRICSRSASTRWRRSRCAASTARTASGSRSTSGCPRSSPTPGCSNGSSRTWSTTRCGTAAARRWRCAPAPITRGRGRGTGAEQSGYATGPASSHRSSSCGSSTPAPASRATPRTGCSPRSSGSATATRAGSASG